MEMSCLVTKVTRVDIVSSEDIRGRLELYQMYIWYTNNCHHPKFDWSVIGFSFFHDGPSNLKSTVIQELQSLTYELT